MNQVATAEMQEEQPPVQIALPSEAVDAINTAVDLIEKGSEVKIENQDHLEKATTLRSWISSQIKKLDEIRMNTVRPYNSAVGEANAKFKETLDPLKQAKTKIGQAMQAFMEEQERHEREEAERKAKEEAARIEAQRKAAEEAALAEAEKLQEQGNDQEAQKLLDEASEQSEALAETPPPPSVPATTTARGTMGGSANLKKVWTFELDPDMDPAEAVKLVPEAYLVAPEERLNAKVIRAAISGGSLQKIPGLRVYQKSQLASR